MQHIIMLFVIVTTQFSIPLLKTLILHYVYVTFPFTMWTCSNPYQHTISMAEMYAYVYFTAIITNNNYVLIAQSLADI